MPRLDSMNGVRGARSYLELRASVSEEPARPRATTTQLLGPPMHHIDIELMLEDWPGADLSGQRARTADELGQEGADGAFATRKPPSRLKLGPPMLHIGNDLLEDEDEDSTVTRLARTGYSSGTRVALRVRAGVDLRFTAQEDSEDEVFVAPPLVDAVDAKSEKEPTGPRIYEGVSGKGEWRPSSVRSEWEATWRHSKPQRTIYLEGLPRDKWVPVVIPRSFNDLQMALRLPDVQMVLSDPVQRNAWIYALGRTAFFFTSSVLVALLQIQAEPDWRPWVAGANWRREVESAFKRIATSGERDRRKKRKGLRGVERILRLFGSVFELYRRDCQNIYNGIYRYPYDASLLHRQFNPLFVRNQFLRTLEESIRTGERRAKGENGKREVLDRLFLRELEADAGVVLVEDMFEGRDNIFNDRYLLGDMKKYPDYYLQNFHWQTDGWMSTSSAASYEYTTEVLFEGTQDAMQRQGFVSISEYVALNRGIRTEEEISLLEVACGTGRLHTFIKDNWPNMKTVASDLSPFYLQRARENMEYFEDFTKRVTGRDITPTDFVQAAAEDLPFEDGMFDIVTCTYLFHEVPFPVRKQIAREMFRVMAPGGVCVITDSFQRGDIPERDHVGRRFPANYHEPYYTSYFENTDMVKLFQEAGFVMRRHQVAHLSKVLTFEKPDPENKRIAPYAVWAIV